MDVAMTHIRELADKTMRILTAAISSVQESKEKTDVKPPLNMEDNC